VVDRLPANIQDPHQGQLPDGLEQAGHFLGVSHHAFEAVDMKKPDAQ